jgi:signal transduction histidine kinase
MPNGGTLTIALNESESFATVSVSDTGCGISPENMERLFTPFFTTKSSGTGLGLCNVRRSAEALGGAVEAESTLGEGSKFVLKLPLRGFE